jgi:hypothetical protein
MAPSDLIEFDDPEDGPGQEIEVFDDELTLRGSSELLADSPTRLIDFMDPIRYSEALELAGWGVDDEVLELVRVAKQDAKLAPKLQAIKMLHKFARDAAVLTGLVAKVSATQTEGGRTITVDQVRLAASKAVDGAKKLPVVKKGLVDGHDENDKTTDQEGGEKSGLFETRRRPKEDLGGGGHRDPFAT